MKLSCKYIDNNIIIKFAIFIEVNKYMAIMIVNY